MYVTWKRQKQAYHFLQCQLHYTTSI